MHALHFPSVSQVPAKIGQQLKCVEFLAPQSLVFTGA